MKTIATAICSFFLVFCLPSFADEIVKQQISISDNVCVSLDSYKQIVKTIKFDGKRFEAKDQNNVITQVDFKITNNSDNKVESPNFNEVELAIALESSQITYLSPDQTLMMYTDPREMFSKQEIPGKTSVNKTFYFVRPKTSIPIGIVYARSAIIRIEKKDNQFFQPLVKNITDEVIVMNLMKLAKERSFSEIDTYLQANSLPINIHDHYGYSIFDYSIIFQNNDLLSSLLKTKYDINERVKYNGDSITPIQLSILANNADAFTLLLNAGADMTAKFPNGDDIAKGVIRNNAYRILPIIIRTGTDISVIRIKLIGGNPYDPLSFAKNKQYTEMIDILTQYYHDKKINIQ